MKEKTTNASANLRLEDLLEDSKENFSIVSTKLMEMRHVGDPSITEAVSVRYLEKLIHEKHQSCKVITTAKIDNFTYHKGKLPRLCYQAIVTHLWDLGAWKIENKNQNGGAKLEEDTLFHALVNFLEIPSQTLNNLFSELHGTYHVWRASMHVPGSYVHGMMEINYQKTTGALWAVETHVFNGGNDVNSKREKFEGYLIKKSRFYVIIARERKSHSGPPRMTIIHNVLKDKETNVISELYGFVTGCYGSNALFSAPVYMERVSNSELATRLGDQIEVTDDIPFSIRAKLKIRVEDGIIRF